MTKAVVLGATGYVGGKLVPELIREGHEVRCVVRDLPRASLNPWSGDVVLITGDALKKETLAPAIDGADIVFYLVHSMSSRNRDFRQQDRIAALNVAEAAGNAGAKRIIYLGGLGKRGVVESAHLKSRHEVGDILRDSGVPLTEFRAAVIVGSGSVSFEIVRYLVKRLPVMICPRWLYTRTQPIAASDVVQYLVECLKVPESTGKIIDIGGSEILTFREMILITARVLNVRRYLIHVPVLTPRLSSYWVNLVTPIPSHIAGALIDGLRYETVCENDAASKLFDIRPMSYQEAVEIALASAPKND